MLNDGANFGIRISMGKFLPTYRFGFSFSCQAEIDSTSTRNLSLLKCSIFVPCKSYGEKNLLSEDEPLAKEGSCCLMARENAIMLQVSDEVGPDDSSVLSSWSTLSLSPEQTTRRCR